ncbi:MAG: hypothetical protein JRG97_12920 [Deltaproteobacteria bacterium]|nr:hypothetical protein [Deltaproteobacteria bacterium]MBW2053367.1 hypothetical protein [Deltaproteobacteria bacterium]MBW2141950.1 hypothetical protein [Deltaproteobacteria bacterium]MBW2323639.1 hypothetical protein [Deltaproteobacteria bacterium]
MLVKFKRRHRFFEAGEEKEVPDHIGVRMAQSGIVTIIDEDKGSTETAWPEDKAIKGTVRASSTRKKKKKGGS